MHEHKINSVIINFEGDINRCICGAERRVNATVWKKSRTVESYADGYGISVEEYLERTRYHEPAHTRHNNHVPEASTTMKHSFLSEK